MGAIVVAAGGPAAMQTLVAAGGCSVAMEAFAVGRRLRSSSGGSCFLALRGKLGLVVLAQQQWRPLLWRVVAQFSFQINVQRVAPLSPPTLIGKGRVYGINIMSHQMAASLLC